MSLAVCVFITWIIIIFFSLIPKKLSELDMVIIYFFNVIFELSIFTILHVNFKIIVVSHTFEHSFADLVLRFIFVPLVFVITANILLYPWRIMKWIIVAAIILCFPLMEHLLHWLEILKTRHWNVGYNLLMTTSYAVFSSAVAWLLTRLDRKEVKKA